MARKDRTLAGFDDVANGNDKDKETSNHNDETIPSVKSNTEEQENGDFLDKMLNNGLPKKQTDMHLHGIYLDPELSKLLNRLGKQGGRGAKTRIANDAMRKYFKDKGLL